MAAKSIKTWANILFELARIFHITTVEAIIMIVPQIIWL
jgi:hypothetical protein